MSLLISFFAASAILSPRQGADAATLYKNALPSIARIEVQKAGGATQGTAFLAIKDGLAVTCWHVVRNAESAKVRFSNGEEFDVSGLIDKDEKRDVALIRVKVADRPFLAFAKGDPEVGAKAYAIGSPEGLDFSISDGVISQIRDEEGMKVYQFSCPVSHGSSGGPLLNEKGEVLGLVAKGLKEGQNLNFAAPITYVKGLDSSLPTTPWDKVKKEKSQPGKTDGMALIAYIAQSLKDLHHFALRLHCVTEEIMAGHADYPGALFVEESLRIAVRADTLKASEADGKIDDIRRIVSGLADLTALTAERLRLYSAHRNSPNYLTEFIANYRIVEVEEGRSAFEGPEVEALRKEIGDRLLTKLMAARDQKGWRPGETDRESRKRFVGGYTLLSRLAYDVDSTGYVFGFLVDANNPALLYDVQGRTPPREWGFRKGDLIVSVQGKPVSSFEEMKAELIRIGKKTSEVVVKRGDREAKLKVNPSAYLKD